MDYKEKYHLWLENVKDEKLLVELQLMTNDEEKMKLAFMSDLKFGTAGLRGTMGAGTNCMNVLTVARASQGLANYLISHNAHSIVVSFDSRNNSDVFAKISASVFATSGLNVYITHHLQPTPFLSYAITALKVSAGVMVTASHNPREYNGYKVYGESGGQMLDDECLRVTEEIEKVDIFGVKYEDFFTLLNNGKINYTTTQLRLDYLDKVYEQRVGSIENIKIIYSALNGCGYRLIPDIFEKCGFTNYVKVVEQSFPNGNFTTCPYPNPEKNETLELGIRYAKENNADILLASDPDCDRVGTAVLNKGQYVILSGQEIGVLLTDFILCERTKSKTLTPDSVIVKSIVSTDLAKKVASGYGVKTIDVLTGFKYIGNIITELTASGHQNDFVFGFEESCGYLAGVYAHDKDAVVACMLLAQMCSAYKKRGLTLIDRLEQIYSKYGKFNHKTVSFSFGGSVGAEKMKNLMDKLRSDKLSEIEGLSIIGTQDLLQKVEFPVSADVLIYTLEGDCKVIVRPSGTEPLIKVYLTVKGNESLATKIMSKFVDFFNCYFD